MNSDKVDGGAIIYHPPPPLALIDEISRECRLLSVVNKRCLLCKRAATHFLCYVHLSKRKDTKPQRQLVRNRSKQRKAKDSLVC